jgi:acyl-CoA thioesterase I
MADMKSKDFLIKTVRMVKTAYTMRDLLLIRTIMAAFGSLLIALTFLLPVQAFAASADKPTWLIMGDSLSAEYGLKRGSGWVFNASISGETTSGGKTRLPSLLAKYKPQLVVIELGGNDALRGLEMASTQANLAEMIAASQKIKAKVLLIGMKLPPNFGKSYGEKFEGMFKTLANNGVTFVPFFLEGFGEDLSYFQADRIHPTEAAQPKMLANVWPALKQMSKD